MRGAPKVVPAAESVAQEAAQARTTLAAVTAPARGAAVAAAAAMPAPFTLVETMATVVMRNGEMANCVRVHGMVSLVGARSRANSQGDFACAKAAVLKTN